MRAAILYSPGDVRFEDRDIHDRCEAGGFAAGRLRLFLCVLAG